MITQNKTKKIISSSLIILILLPYILLSSPKKSYAVWITGVDPAAVAPNVGNLAVNTENAATNVSMLGLELKKVAIAVGKELLKAVAKRVLAEMTKATINWINKGFAGSPLFLENPQSFFTDIAKSELRTIVDTFGYNNLLYPFGKDFALNAINSYKNQLADNAGYTLSKVMNSAQQNNYRNDFNYGGWNGFLINTQYPQNNYLGFNMIATEELARRIQGTSQNAAQKVQSLLQQGAGFLSPQTCPSNPSYNNGTNEFQKPSFDEAAYNQQHPSPTPPTMGDEVGVIEDQIAMQKWTADHDYAKSEWAQKNTCPGGLKNTTPGSVAGSQVMKALGTSFDQTVMDGAMGNSLSAIFDALLTHFLDKGLSALASTTNPAPITDDWSYNGQTLGSPVETGTNQSWNWGPDQPIVLGDCLTGGFKKIVCDAIESVTTELNLMYNDDANNPGIYQMFSKIWPKAQELDACIPGPDVMGLKDRLDGEVSRINVDMQDKVNGIVAGDNQKETDLVSKELTFAMKLFKDWIDNAMMPELPSSLIFMDSVKNITTLSQGMSELTDNRIAKNRALIRLKAIKTNLDTITTQPSLGSAEEKILVSIWKQYQAGSVDFSNTNTIESTRNKLSEAKDIYKNLVDSMNPSNPTGCPAERTKKGWSNPGGPDGVFGGKTEKALFCDLPINGGYSHGIFINNGEVTYPDIPLINAPKVLEYREITLESALSGFASSLNIPVFWKPIYEDTAYNVVANCDNIFNAGLVAYKGDLPGTTVGLPANTSSSTATTNNNSSTTTTNNPSQNNTVLNDLSITPSSVSITIYQATNLLILNGIAPYVITDQKDRTVAKAEILSSSPNFITITALKPGTTSITVRDSSNPSRAANVAITISDIQINF